MAKTRLDEVCAFSHFSRPLHPALMAANFVLMCPTQVMEEGERLSKKQLAQESTIKKLRASMNEAAEQRASLESALASERSRLQGALAARAAADDARQVPFSFSRAGQRPGLITQ